MTYQRYLSLAIFASLFGMGFSEVKKATSGSYVTHGLDQLHMMLSEKVKYVQDNSGDKLAQKVVDLVAHHRAFYHSKEGSGRFDYGWIRLLILPRHKIISESKTKDFQSWIERRKGDINKLLEGGKGEIIGMGVGYIHEEFFSEEKVKHGKTPQLLRASHLVLGFTYSLNIHADEMAVFEELCNEFPKAKFNTLPKFTNLASIMATRNANSNGKLMQTIEYEDIWFEEQGSCYGSVAKDKIKTFLKLNSYKFSDTIEITVSWIKHKSGFEYDAKQGDKALKWTIGTTGSFIFMARFPTETSDAVVNEIADVLNSKNTGSRAAVDKFAMKVAEIARIKYEKERISVSTAQVDRPMFARIILFPVEKAEYTSKSFQDLFIDTKKSVVLKYAKNNLGFGFSLKMFRDTKTNRTEYMAVMVFIVDEPLMYNLRINTSITIDAEALVRVSEYARSGVCSGLNVLEDTRRELLPIDRLDPEYETKLANFQTAVVMYLHKSTFAVSIAMTIWRPPKTDAPFLAVIYINNHNGTGLVLQKLEARIEKKNLSVNDFTDIDRITPVIIQDMIECLFKVRGNPAWVDEEFFRFLKISKHYMSDAQTIAVNKGNNIDMRSYQANIYIVLEWENANVNDSLEIMFQDMKKHYGHVFTQMVVAVGLYVNEDSRTAYLVYYKRDF